MLMTVAWNNDSVEERFAGKVYQESGKDAVVVVFSAIEKKTSSTTVAWTKWVVFRV